MLYKLKADDLQSLPGNTALNAAVEIEKKCIQDLELVLQQLGNTADNEHSQLIENTRKSVSKMLLAHGNLKNELLKSCCSVSSAFMLFMQQIGLYLDYCCYLKRMKILKISELGERCMQQDFMNVLNQPVTHIKKYEEILCNLCKVLPESEGKVLNGICEAMQKTIIEMDNIFSATENALKVLWIQKCLVRSQPKIFTAGRILLKEGSLMKVNRSGRAACEREFFLFTDILLCCKRKRCCTGIHKKSSLKCCSVIPLQSSSVRSILTSKFEGEDLFKVSWDNNTYVLFSKTVGISQSWIKDIQSAIRNCKEMSSENHKCDLLTKNCALKRSTAVTKRPGLSRDSSQVEINSSALSTGEALAGHSYHRSLFPLAAMRKLLGL